MFEGWPFLLGLAVLLAGFNAWFFLRHRKVRILVSAYGDIQENRIFIDLIREFREKFPDIQVDLQRFPFAEYAKSILDAIPKGTGPDVVLMDSVHYNEFIFNDILEPLNPYFMGEEMDIKSFYPQVVDRFFLEGYLYAVPRDVAPICMVYYNKRAFDEAKLPYPKDDWNWDQFVATAKKLMKTDSAGRVTRWGFVEGWAMLEAWIYDAAGSFVDDIKNPTRWTVADDPNSLTGLLFRWDLINKYKVMPPPSVWSGNNDSDGAEMFAEGRAAMILFGLWKTPRFREIREFQWDAALLPRNPSGYLNFTLTGSAYGIPKSSRNKSTAWKFVKYVAGEEGTLKLAADGLAQPALEKIAHSEVFLDGKDPQNKKLLLDAMKHGCYAPLCLNWDEVKSIIEQELTPAWEGKATVHECLDRLRALLAAKPPQTR